jgi:hypothetical protein
MPRSSTTGTQPSFGGLGDVGLALRGVVDRERLVDDLELDSDLDDQLGQLKDRELLGLPVSGPTTSESSRPEAAFSSST